MCRVCDGRNVHLPLSTSIITTPDVLCDMLKESCSFKENKEIKEKSRLRKVGRVFASAENPMSEMLAGGPYFYLFV